ncbi:MAG: hypothetical protein HC809_10760 [Gammaproteobacteria bacterium]|nr:hypothetical protein [Gammaproteobacteria bacterium]
MRRIAGRDLRPSGVVRLTTTDSLHAVFVAEMAGRCRARHPEIALHVTTSNETHNLSRRDADIAIRPTDKPPEHLIGKRIGPVAMAAYGSVSYLRATRRLGNLAAHAWIGLDESLSYHRSLKWLAKVTSLAALVYRSNTFTGVQQACLSGLGLAILPCFMADSDARLRRVTPAARRTSSRPLAAHAPGPAPHGSRGRYLRSTFRAVPSSRAIDCRPFRDQPHAAPKLRLISIEPSSSPPSEWFEKTPRKGLFDPDGNDRCRQRIRRRLRVARRPCPWRRISCVAPDVARAGSCG